MSIMVSAGALNSAARVADAVCVDSYSSFLDRFFNFLGNGTQDILCSTYDPRYLYVSLHAGGPEVNGVVHDDDPNHELHDLGSNPKSGGIYPGRCGDTSPHKGVLNIPLGPQVVAHDVGTALVRHVSPTVEAFAPELILLSAGFDAHKNDPMGLGRLSAEDFGHITDVLCQLAFNTCNGRLLSVLEGGYGVPCCRPQRDTPVEIPLPPTSKPTVAVEDKESGLSEATAPSLSCVVIAENSDNPANPTTSDTASASVDNVGSAGNPSLQPESVEGTPSAPSAATQLAALTQQPPPSRPQPTKLLDLGSDLPETMDDQVPYALQRRLEKCHAEGFLECVREHVSSLARCNTRV